MVYETPFVLRARCVGSRRGTRGLGAHLLLAGIIGLVLPAAPVAADACVAARLTSQQTFCDISGDFALLGPEVYRFVDDRWTFQTELAADREASSSFASVVALDGDLAVVGDPVDDNLGKDAGAVYVFRRQGEIWTQEARLLPSRPEENGRFGFAVAADVNVSGDAIAIASYGVIDLDGQGGPATVFVHPYRYDGNAWLAEGRLTPATATPFILIPPGSVDLDGDTIVLGQSQELVNKTPYQYGAVHVYRYDGQAWSGDSERLVDDADVGGFGSRVSVDGNRIMVTTVSDVAYIFDGVCACAEECGVPANGNVDTVDLLLLIGHWGQRTDTCDLTGDGVIDTADLLALLGAWGVCVQ